MKRLCDEENICVFVANLPSTLTDSEICERLRAELHAFGQISYVKASRDRKGRPFAFVQFIGPVVDFLLTSTVTVEDRVLRFERAKSNFYQSSLTSESASPSSLPYPPHGYLRSGLPATASFRPKLDDSSVPFNPSAEGAAMLMSHILTNIPDEAVQYSSLSEHRVLVTGLDCETVTLRKLLRRFQMHGHIADIEFHRRSEMGASIAIVSYATKEAALKAAEAENTAEWLGQRIRAALITEMSAAPSPPVHLDPNAYFYGSEWYAPGTAPLDHPQPPPNHPQQLYPYFY